jgi:hypothetical protein
MVCSVSSMYSEAGPEDNEEWFLSFTFPANCGSTGRECEWL